MSDTRAKAYYEAIERLKADPARNLGYTPEQWEAVRANLCDLAGIGEQEYHPPEGFKSL